MNGAKLSLLTAIFIATAFTFLACEEKGKGAEAGGGEAGNTFTDARDGKKYRFVKIGEQTWMAENLNYAAEGSECDEPPNCDKYGRRYNWDTAIKVCPSGWHLPSSEEWKVLTDFVGEYPGKKLKATNGWNDYNKASGNGTDEYGFAALPGGGRYSGGNGGVWWRGTNCISMEYNSEYAQEFFCETHNSFSVRCIQGEVSSEEIAMSEAAVAAADSIAAYSSFPDEDRGFGCYTAETGELKIRACAGTECEVIGELGQGALVCPRKITGEWAEFPYGYDQGYKGYTLLSHLKACPIEYIGSPITVEATFLESNCGDSGCYVSFRLSNGEELWLMGDNELEEGTKVSVTYRKKQYWESSDYAGGKGCYQRDELQSMEVLSKK